MPGLREKRKRGCQFRICYSLPLYKRRLALIQCYQDLCKIHTVPVAVPIGNAYESHPVSTKTGLENLYV